MIDVWLIELAKGIGRFFLNPVVYWSIIFLCIIGSIRIKRERSQFATKIFDAFAEIKQTWVVSIVGGLVLSLALVGVGFVLHIEVLFIMCAYMLLLSLFFRLSFLSATYATGLTYATILLLPKINVPFSFNEGILSEANLTGLALIAGFLIILEGAQLKKTSDDDSFPGLTVGSRGAWTGEHRMKKLQIIPFFCLIPGGAIPAMDVFWPMLEIGGASYGFILLPFMMGYDYPVRGERVQDAAKHIAGQYMLLGLIVLAFAIASIFYPIVSILAVIAALIGKELIVYRFKTKDKHQVAYYGQMEKGIQILGIIHGSPAAELGMLPGETIRKVNNEHINSVERFYEALQKSGAFFKLEVLDHKKEVRIVQRAIYEGDHHELGILFTTEPYRNVHKNKMNVNVEKAPAST